MTCTIVLSFREKTETYIKRLLPLMLSCDAVPLKAGKVLHQLTYRGKSIILVEINLPGGTTNQKHYPDLGSDSSSVWNFCARFSDVIWRGNLVVELPNVGCFLRPTYKATFSRVQTFFFSINDLLIITLTHSLLEILPKNTF